jgi:hypothetical protein
MNMLSESPALPPLDPHSASGEQNRSAIRGSIVISRSRSALSFASSSAMHQPALEQLAVERCAIFQMPNPHRFDLSSIDVDTSSLIWRLQWLFATAARSAFIFRLRSMIDGSQPGQSTQSCFASFATQTNHPSRRAFLRWL